jgi:hypothetical protein
LWICSIRKQKSKAAWRGEHGKKCIRLTIERVADPSPAFACRDEGMVLKKGLITPARALRT